MSKHTPGPWRVNYAKFSEVRAENGAVIAECKKLAGLVNLQANARLIAAAPALLKALQGMLSGVKFDNDGSGYAEVVLTTDDVAAARAAIAAATNGKSA